MRIALLIWSFIRPIFTKVGVTVTRHLFSVAMEYVAEAATKTDWKPEQKRAWVAEQLQKEDFGTGYPIADSLINFAIEVAVQRLKGKQAAK